MGCVLGQFGGYLEWSFLRLSSCNVWNLMVDAIAYCYLLLSSLGSSAYNAWLEWCIFLLANLQDSQGTSLLPMAFIERILAPNQNVCCTDTRARYVTLHATNFRNYIRNRRIVSNMCLICTPDMTRLYIWSVRATKNQNSGHEIVMVFVKCFPSFVLFCFDWEGLVVAAGELRIPEELIT